jgi:4-hydroxymandelate oxidase
LRSIVGIPVVLKGILDPEDAQRAVTEGADAIVVSNHGGRNVDSVPATIDSLPVQRTRERTHTGFDGWRRPLWHRCAQSVAYGASAVMIGRPFLYLLAVAGAHGVERVIRILRQDSKSRWRSPAAIP